MGIAAWGYQGMNSNHVFGGIFSWKQDFQQWKDVPTPLLLNWESATGGRTARKQNKNKNVYPEYYQAFYWTMPGIEGFK